MPAEPPYAIAPPTFSLLPRDKISIHSSFVLYGLCRQDVLSAYFGLAGQPS